MTKAEPQQGSTDKMLGSKPGPLSFPRWQVHRGYWLGGVRENTLAAFKEAHRLSCSMVEMDVQRSRDGKIHVFHDFFLTRLFKINKKFSSLRSDDLAALNIPLLATVLSSDETPPFMNIEIKSKKIGIRKDVLEIVRVVRKYGKHKTVMVSSFNPLALFWMKKICPSIPRALLIKRSDILMSWKFDKMLSWTQPQFINCHYELVDQQVTRNRLLSFERELILWTVNDIEKAHEYLKRGVSGVISDQTPGPVISN